jgi:hypothetical protein
MAWTRMGLVAAAAAVAVSHAGCKHSGSEARGEGATPRGAPMAAQGSAVAAPAQATATPQPVASQVEGRLEAIDRGNNVTLAGSEAVGHAFDRFRVDSDTKITVNGEEADLAELNEGDEVRASYSTSDGELHLDRLEVLSPAVSGSGETR